MNSLGGNIESLSCIGNITIADVRVGNVIIHSVVIADQNNAFYLQEGVNVELLFNESEVMLGKDISGILSLENAVLCTIQTITQGTVFTNLVLSLQGNAIHSLIPTRSYRKMKIFEGDEVTVFIKMTDIFIQFPEKVADD